MFLQCRKRGLVNRRRVNQPFGPKKNRALPILPMSYQLSQSYYRYWARPPARPPPGPCSGSFNQLQCVGRSFSTRFPHSLFTDAFRFLETLKTCQAGDRRPTIEFYTETANRLENGDEMKESGMGKKQGAVRTGRAGGDAEATINEPAREGEKPKEEETIPGGRHAPDPAEAPRATQPEDAAEAPEEAPDVSDMMPFSLDSPGGACAASLSLMSLGMLNLHLSIPKHMVVVDSNLVDTETVKR